MGCHISKDSNNWQSNRQRTTTATMATTNKDTQLNSSGGSLKINFPFLGFLFFFRVLLGRNANESGPVGLTALYGGCSQWKSDEKQINNQSQEKQGKAK